MTLQYTRYPSECQAFFGGLSEGFIGGSRAVRRVLPERMGGPVRLVLPGIGDVCRRVEKAVRLELEP
jgi:hypothetical protein